jgi:hypothetical protein
MRVTPVMRFIAAVTWMTMMAGCGMDAAGPRNIIDHTAVDYTSAAVGGTSLQSVTFLFPDGSTLKQLKAPFDPPKLTPEMVLSLDQARRVLLDGSLDARIKDKKAGQLLKDARAVQKLFDAGNERGAIAYMHAHFTNFGRSENTVGASVLRTLSYNQIPSAVLSFSGMVKGARRTSTLNLGTGPTVPVARQVCYEEQCDPGDCVGDGCYYSQTDIDDYTAYVTASIEEVDAMTAGIDPDMTGTGDATIEQQNCNGARHAMWLAVALFLASTGAYFYYIDQGQIRNAIRAAGAVGVALANAVISKEQYDDCMAG